MDMTKQDVQYHIGLGQGDAGGYCILPGDPGRCERIAALLDNRCFVHSNREFTTWAGTLEGEKVSVVSTGIGGPSAAIAVEELHQIGVHTFLRIGTCGGIRLDDAERRCGRGHRPQCAWRVPAGSMPHRIPRRARLHRDPGPCGQRRSAGLSCKVGVVQCKGQLLRPALSARMPVSFELEQKWEAWKRLGVLASEMESAAMFTVAAALGVRSGACFHVIWNQEREKAGLDQIEKRRHRLRRPCRRKKPCGGSSGRIGQSCDPADLQRRFSSSY